MSFQDFEKMMENEVNNYDATFSGTSLDKQLDKMIEEKMGQGFDEAQILEDLVKNFGGKQFEQKMESDNNGEEGM